MKNGRRDGHSYAEWDYIYASPFSWDNAIDADQKCHRNGSRRLFKTEIEMDIKLKMESSDSAKEPSRRSPFVRGLSGQNYNFSSGYSPFIGGAPGDRRWTPYTLHCGTKMFHYFLVKAYEIQQHRERAVQEKHIGNWALRSKLQFLFRATHRL